MLTVDKLKETIDKIEELYRFINQFASYKYKFIEDTLVKDRKDYSWGKSYSWDLNFFDFDFEENNIDILITKTWRGVCYDDAIEQVAYKIPIDDFIDWYNNNETTENI